MKIGASISAYEDVSLEEGLESVESNDYIDYLELLYDYPYLCNHNEEELIDIINSYSIKYTIHAPFIDLNIASLNSAARKMSVLETKRSIDFASKIDSDIVVVHPGRISYQGRNKEDLVYGIAKDSLREIGDYAKNLEINACIENLPQIQGMMYPDVNMLNETLTELGLPMTLDIGHAHTAGFTSDEIYFDSIKHIHVHDNPGDDDTHLALGEGTFDLNGFFDTFIKNKYDGIYMLELNSIDLIEKSLDYMKNLKLI